MRIWIKRVILWPKNEMFDRREVLFEDGCVNIVWGDSRTGKSALIPVIDYCLCSSDCGIPVDVIRDTCSWYGVLLGLDEGEILLCRKEPGRKQTSGDMLFERGRSVQIPDRVECNANVEDVKLEVNRFLGVTSFDAFDESDAFSGRPSFRDFAAFLYQPQNIIANPEALFYKLDDMNHKRKLAKIFPYILGAVTERDLALQEELNDINQEIARKERELAKVKDVSERWLRAAEAQVLKAADLGLIDAVPEVGSSFEELLAAIGAIVGREGIDARLSESGMDEAASRLAALRDNEAEISRRLSKAQARRSDIVEAQNAFMAYDDASSQQADYLGITDWLIDRQDADGICPICGSTMPNVAADLEALKKRRENLVHPGALFEIGGTLEKEKIQVEAEIRGLSESLGAVRKAVDDIEAARTERAHRSEEVSRFLGKLDAEYERLSAIGDSSDLERELEGLRGRKRELQAALGPAGQSERMKKALTKISLLANRFIAELDVENPDWQIEFDYKNLALKILDNNGQSRYLNQVGSASNWLSYHIAFLLALHGYFREFEPVGIPAFMICDQPSQVYFPHNEAEENRDDRDKEAVTKIFRLLGAFVGGKHQFQLIVTEHAGKDIWGDIDAIHEVSHWKEDGEKLVPQEWVLTMKVDNGDPEIRRLNAPIVDV